VLGRNYTYAFDVTTWGWIHLILGIVVFLAGFALFSGASWARVVATILAMVGVIENFMALPYFPVWSIILIALNIAVIWAVTLTRNDMA
jgi:hypothetical protein